MCVFTIEKRLDGWESRLSWENHEDFLIMTHTLSCLFTNPRQDWVSSKNKDIPWQVNYSLSIKCGKSIEARVGKKERIPLANYEETTCRFQHSQLCMCVYIDCFSYYTQFSTGSALTLHLHMKWGVDNCSFPLLMIGQKSFQVFSFSINMLNLIEAVIYCNLSKPIHSTLSIFLKCRPRRESLISRRWRQTG